MAEKKVYELLKVRTPFGKTAEFHDFWRTESLPVWLEHGVKHVGSYTNFIGDPMNEIVRLFEFDGISHWDEWETFLREDKGAQVLINKKLAHYIESVEKKLLLPIY